MLSRQNSSSNKSWPPLHGAQGGAPLPRRMPRRLIWLAVGAILLVVTLRWQGVLSSDYVNVDEVQTAAEEELIEMLVKQKDAVEKDTTVEVSTPTLLSLPERSNLV